MNPPSDPSILQLLLLLIETLGRLVIELGVLGLHWFLWIAWAALWLLGVNAHKARHALASGGWAPVVLLMVLIALVWSRIVPGPCPYCGIPEFWWQLGSVSLLAGIALFCGWLQTVFHWTPRDINLDPPAHGHAHGHEHAHH